MCFILPGPILRQMSNADLLKTFQPHDYELLLLRCCWALHLLTCIHVRDNILTEQQMMEDKIKATDWEATNEAIEEQV